MPIDYNKISKLHRLKAWVAQRPTTVALGADGLVMTAWYAGLTNIGANPTLTEKILVNGTTIAAALAVGFLHEKYKKTLSSEHSDIFPSKAIAKKVITHATAVMSHIDKEYGITALEEALRSLERHIIVSNHRRPSHLKLGLTRSALPTPGGFQLHDTKTLPAEVETSLGIVMHETITTYLENYSDYAEIHSNSGNGRRYLPLEAQTYIILYHPELALKNPLLFSDESLDKHTRGLAGVVQTLAAMSCSVPAMREHIEAWIETKKIDNHNPDLPEDLLGFR